MTPEILYEDKYIIVCIKPAGIATQTKSIGSPDMVSILKNHIMENEDVKGEPYLAVIHRLDQPTSGILVFAKTKEAARELNRQLKEGDFSKHYLAELRSIPIPREGTLEHYMVKDGKANLMRICTEDTPDAKLARLFYRVIKINDDSSCIAEVILDTGRQHQIRTQMSAIKCPIAGDSKYGPKEPLKRQLGLYACRLSFRHPKSQNTRTFKWNPLGPIPGTDYA